MKSRTQDLNRNSAGVSDRFFALAPTLLAISLGVFLVYGAGFAGATVLHNAAHDARHSFAFPCH